jgi:two-component system, OmpR family, response regulator
MTFAELSADPCRVLLVEDDARLAALVREYLEQQGFAVTIEARGDRASARILNERPNVVVLDLMLPGCDGFEICRNVRTRYTGPILMLTSRGEDIDQVVGLELGADDYVTKPVQPRVLLARIRALLRRGAPNHAAAQPAADERDLLFGSLAIRTTARDVHLNGRRIDLTDNEFELLCLLAHRAGEVLSRDALLAALRNIDYDGLDRSVDLRISRLRKKLRDDPAQPTRIKTIRAKGYMFVADAWY